VQGEERADTLQELIDELEDEVLRERAKLASEFTRKAELLEEISRKDSMINEIEKELNALRELLQNKEISLEKLEEQMQLDDALEHASSTQLRELHKQVTQYQGRIRELELKLKESEEANQELTGQLASAVKAQKSHSKEKAHMLENISQLKGEVEELKTKAKEREDKFSEKLTAVTTEFTARIAELKRRNFELEDTIEEMQDSLEIGRQSIVQESLGDEFNQLDEYRPSRFSIAPRSDSKPSEATQAQLSEKEAMIKALQSEKEQYSAQAKQANSQLLKVRERYVEMIQKKEVESERLRVQLREAQARKNSDELRRLGAEVADLRSEVDKHQTQLKASGESWSSENNSLRLSLFEAEQTAVKYKLQYTEASTDRDIYIKKYQDILRFRGK
jgi:chromosome segregation ATPase